MRIFELLNQPGQALDQPDQNDEDDDQGKFDAGKVEQNLQDISQQVDDHQAQPDQPGQDQQAPPELDDMNPEPIDSALISQVKTLPYSKKYEFDDNDPRNPVKICGMKLEELNHLSSKVRYKMQLISMANQVGTEDNKNMEFCTDLLRVVNTVMHFKKSNTKAQLAATNPSPTWQNQGNV